MAEIVKKQFGRVYIGYTIYSLYLYLIYSSEEEIEDTFFFVGEGIDQSVRDKLKNKYYFSNKQYENRNNLSRFLYRLRLRYQSRKKWSFLKDAQLFAQDHFYFSPALIGSREYVLIEDAPNVFTYHRNILNAMSSSLVLTYIKKNILRIGFGNSFGGEMGDNSFCKSILITNIESDPILENKELLQIKEKECWDHSSESKQRKILDIFNVTADDVSHLKTRNIIVFTQNFVDLGYISEEELIEIYFKSLEKYTQNQVVIKNHPLDRVNYQKYFPEAYVFNKRIPMQLLNLLDIKYDTAITICSSAAFSFPYDLTIDWIGTKVNQKLLNALGDQKMK